MELYKIGQNCIIAESAKIGENTVIGHNVIIEENVSIGKNSTIESNTIIKKNVSIGEGSFIGANCILGEGTCRDGENLLEIGKAALIRSGSILYTGSKIGDNFQTGHHVTIREKAEIGNCVSIGTLTDIQGNCKIGDYVRMHSNVHIGQLSVVDSFVWIFPYTVLTNDPTPPSEKYVGVHIRSFAIVATGAILMPGVNIAQDSLVAAGAIITKDVERYSVVAGNPGKVISDVRKIKSKFTGEHVYPWRDHFKTHMPWEESDFQTWYADLELEERKHYHLDRIVIEEESEIG